MVVPLAPAPVHPPPEQFQLVPQRRQFVRVVVGAVVVRPDPRFPPGAGRVGLSLVRAEPVPRSVTGPAAVTAPVPTAAASVPVVVVIVVVVVVVVTAVVVVAVAVTAVTAVAAVMAVMAVMTVAAVVVTAAATVAIVIVVQCPADRTPQAALEIPCSVQGVVHEILRGAHDIAQCVTE